MQKGIKPFRMAEGPKHSDDVVCIDKTGNIAAITHSINCVDWGRTAINIDGISIGDPASFQQAQIAAVKPGGRLPAPTETGVLFKGGKPVLGFASMGSGLHQRTFQCLFNVMKLGMTVEQAINASDFFLPITDIKTGIATVTIPKGRFPEAVLKGMGYAYEEVEPAKARFAGEGLWVAISRDRKTGELRAASPNRNNSAAVAY
jgi:gamma-glutamyltranspeptidase/glutathione hydrolase